MLVVRRVVGPSMWPTLRPGVLVVGWRLRLLRPLWWRLGWLRPGRVLLVRHGGLDKIKRLERIDGRRIYVLGDNPEASTDSRDFGWLDRDAVQAVLFWPLGLAKGPAKLGFDQERIDL